MFPKNLDKLSKTFKCTVLKYNNVEDAIGACNRFRRNNIKSKLSHKRKDVTIDSNNFKYIIIDENNQDKLETVYSYESVEKIV